jgi:hypothetical protein
MSSSSLSSAPSVSYSYGIPGSHVTINIERSGNRSLILSRGPNPNYKTSSSVPVTVPAGQRKFPDGWVGPADMPFCKVCYDAGLPVADYIDHFVKDQPGPTGKVVCPTLLAQKCLMCGLTGHTSSYCSQKIQRDADRAAREREEREKAKKANGGWETVGDNSKPKSRIEELKPKSVAAGAAAAVPTAPPRKTYGGSFGALCIDDSSEESEYEHEQEEIRNTPTNVPKPVAIRRKPILTGPPPAIEPPKPLTWAQRAAAAAQKPVPATSSSGSISAPIKDARFQLHHLCDNIEQSKRAPPRKAQQNEHAPSPAVAGAENSKKRRQDAATVPA